MKTQQEYIEQGEQYILKTYNRFPVVLEKGEGVYLYDADQKKYLDFGAGIAVFALGYGNEAYNQALKDQIDKLIHTSNLYYNIPAVEAAKKIVDASGLKKVFFTNSGTEAIQGALKVARKYAYNKDDSKDYEFIAMNHSFHGRSQGALSVTGNSHYQDGFVPKEFRAVFAEFNNLEDVVSKITDKTCGIICEVVQGEGGMFITNNEDMAKRARTLRSHGMTTMSYQRASGHATSYDITELGYNFRLDDIRASIAIEQLKKLPHDLKMRIKVRNYYLEGLSKIKGVIVPFADSFEFVSNYIMPIVLENSTKEKRDQVREIIHEAGIQTSIHYPAVHRFAIYRDCESELPQTNYVTDNEITLPMYATLTNEQIDFILETVDRAING